MSLRALRRFAFDALRGRRVAAALPVAAALLVSHFLARQADAAARSAGAWSGLGQVGAAFVIGCLCAWGLSRRADRRLCAVQEVIEGVRSGNHQARAALDGTDGAAALARALNTMLDALVAELETMRVIVPQQLEGVCVLQQSLLDSVPLEIKLTGITVRIVQFFGVDLCRVWLIRPGDRCQSECAHAQSAGGPCEGAGKGKCLHLVASSGRTTRTDGPHSRVPLGVGEIGQIACGDDRKLIAVDAANDPRIRDREWARDLGLASFAGYQLRVPAGEPIGVLALFSNRPVQPLEEAMLDGITSAVALAVQQAAAEEALHRAHDDLEVRVQQRTAQLLEANDVLSSEIAERRKAEGARAKAQAERDAVEVQLRQAQKLEAVGQLAAGIAHEINTPTQYLADSVTFLSESFHELKPLFDKYRQVAAALGAMPGQGRLGSEISEAEEAAELAYIEENVPGAFARARDGISRIASIVSAMKDFAHPDSQMKSLADINQSLRTALTIARNEYKYVADVETELGDVPLVMCHPGAINQVFLNLLVNAARAIQEVAAPSASRGRIAVRTALDGPCVRIDIEDTGCGIRPEIRDRVFNPFFTTKTVGQGTGQGLAIARSIVVDKHCGSITFESAVGKGTTFTVRLPVREPEGAPSS